LIKLFGVGWLNKLLPPIVVGPVIMVIGLSLAGRAINNLEGAGSAGWLQPD
jgi:uracil permease